MCGLRLELLSDLGAFFFFQAEDGIRDDLVTGVQTCALPISARRAHRSARAAPRRAGVARVRCRRCSDQAWHVRAAQRLVEEGPPFDVELSGLERHHVFVSEREVVFFEGDSATAVVDALSRSPRVLKAAVRWRG